MIKVKLSNNFPHWPLERQTPNCSGIWRNCQFFINEAVEECDYWVVYEGLTENEETICPKENTILITGEPPSIKRYKQGFVNQFATIITCHRDIKHKNPIFQQQGLPWHIGIRQGENGIVASTLNYDDLIPNNDIPTNKEISVICSNKDATEGYQTRNAFIKELKQKFQSRIDIFGRGYQEIEDKWDGLARYKYHIALENCAIDDYWTEKLSDAYLAGCYPIYYGCSNIEDYFDMAAMSRIDITRVDKALQIIESCINESKYEKAGQKIKEARMDVFNRYNLFALICEHVNKEETLDHSKYVKNKIRPENSTSILFSPIRELLTRLYSKISCNKK